MPRRSAEARTSAAWAASSLGTPKWRNARLLNSRNASMGKVFVSTSVISNLGRRQLDKSMPSNLSRATLLTIAGNEKINGHGRSDENDKGLHPGLRDLLRKVRCLLIVPNLR